MGTAATRPSGRSGSPCCRVPSTAGPGPGVRWGGRLGGSVICNHASRRYHRESPCRSHSTPLHSTPDDIVVPPGRRGPSRRARAREQDERWYSKDSKHSKHSGHRTRTRTTTRRRQYPLPPPPRTVVAASAASAASAAAAAAVVVVDAAAVAWTWPAWSRPPAACVPAPWIPRTRRPRAAPSPPIAIYTWFHANAHTNVNHPLTHPHTNLPRVVLLAQAGVARWMRPPVRHVADTVLLAAPPSLCEVM